MWAVGLACNLRFSISRHIYSLCVVFGFFVCFFFFCWGGGGRSGDVLGITAFVRSLNISRLMALNDNKTSETFHLTA